MRHACVPLREVPRRRWRNPKHRRRKRRPRVGGGPGFALSSAWDDGGSASNLSTAGRGGLLGPVSSREDDTAARGDLEFHLGVSDEQFVFETNINRRLKIWH